VPVDKDTLADIGRTYVAPMTSIRGRRVHRLVMRELAGFDRVLPVAAEEGPSALLGLGDDGSVAVLRTDGRGPSAAIVSWSAGKQAVTTSYDLLKDSLPVVGSTSRASVVAGVGAPLDLKGSELAPADRKRAATALRHLVT
jgi:hypothetical protein